MAFRDFDLRPVLTDFNLTLETTKRLFADVPPVPVSPLLTNTLSIAGPLGAASLTQKGRSEFMVAPVFGEVWHRSRYEVSVLSGAEFDVDASAGLHGDCDFALCRSPNLLFITTPVVVVVEAKRDSIPSAYGQCAAEMVAAQRFNQQANTPTDAVYGCITTGNVWKFLRMVGTHLEIDIDDYHINQPERILGVLSHCCGVTPTP